MDRGELEVTGGFVNRNGYLWPEEDDWCYKVIWDEVADIDEAVRHCGARGIAVQAGGNCGVWANRLATIFGTVYTFEPDPRNFRCLTVNTPDNVFRYQCALGSTIGASGLNLVDGNSGAHNLAGPGNIPVLPLDMFGLQQCDLIVLDIEGYEPMALEGAYRTITRCRPVIMFEEKGLSERFYNVTRGSAQRWLEQYGYRVAGQVRKDVIMVPG